jgi:hypothetical protein
MRLRSLTDLSGRALRRGTRDDIRAIDAALADDERRKVAEAALSLAARMVENRQEDAREASLGDDERSALALLGIDPDDAMSDAEFYSSTSVRDGASRRARMIETALPLAEAARRMNVSGSRLRQRIGEGTLVAIQRPHGRGWLIPAFQITEKGELPYLARVLSARQRSVGADTLARVFELPNEELNGRSPRDWLAAGGAPAPVERILAAL